MWNIERIKKWMAEINDGFSLKYVSWDWDFLAKSKEDDEKEIIRIYYKHKFIDEIVCFDKFRPLYIKSTNIFDIFKKIGILFIPKKILSNGAISWFSCYDENLEKKFTTDGLFWDFTHKYWKIYFHEVTNNNPRNLWKQFVIDNNWKREIGERVKIFSSWNIYQELNAIKDINKEGLYSIYLNQGKDQEKKKYSWAFFLLLKEVLNETKKFFWDTYTVKLEKCTEPLTQFCDSYALAITHKIKIGIAWENEISLNKYIDFHNIILKKFPQLLAVKSKGNNDSSEKYCSFFLKIGNNGEIHNFQKIGNFLKLFCFNLQNGQTIFYPKYPTSIDYSDDNVEIDYKSLYWVTFLINKNERRYAFVNNPDMFYSFLTDENSYLRKFIEGKITQENKGKYKIIFFIWMKILEEKYGKWMYILEIKDGEKVRFLREDWTVIFSMDNFSLDIVYSYLYYIEFNEKTWTCFFAHQDWTINNVVCLNLIQPRYKIMPNINFTFPTPVPSNYYIEQYMKNIIKKTYFVQPENVFDVDFQKFWKGYVIWVWKNWTIHFQKIWIRWLNYLIRENDRYVIEKNNYFDINIRKYKAFYWKLSWNWFLSLLYALNTEIGELTTKFGNPVIVNDNLKVWFFIPLAESSIEQ